MDTIKDRQWLEGLLDSGRAPWLRSASTQPNRPSVLMLSSRRRGRHAPRRVLAIGAIRTTSRSAAAATLLALTRENPELAVDWVVLAARATGRARLAGAPRAFLAGAAATSVEVLGFRDGYLPHTAAR